MADKINFKTEPSTKPLSIDEQYLEYLRNAKKQPEQATGYTPFEMAGKGYGEGGIMGGIAGGVTGLAQYLGTGEGKNILAGLQKDPYLAEAYLEQGKEKTGKESALKQAYAEAEAKRMQNIGDYLNKQETLQQAADIAALEGEQKKAGLGIQKTEAISKIAERNIKSGMTPGDAIKAAKLEIAGKPVPTKQRNWLAFWQPKVQLAEGETISTAGKPSRPGAGNG